MDGSNNGSGIKTFILEVIIITPEIAERFLKKNHPNNRPVNWRRVEALANDMREGAWEVTHQGICFDTEGYLIDGQHRMHAVVASGATVRMAVIKNSTASYGAPIDRGLGRTVGVILDMQNRDVAAISMLRGLESGVITTAHHHLTVNEAKGVFERHKEWFEILKQVPNQGRLSGPQRAAIIWALPIDQEKTLLFTEKLISGEMISRGHPAYAYRAWRDRQKNTEKNEVCMAMLNCLRHFITGDNLTAVYTTDIGYRAVTTRRRYLRIPNTPSADLVLSITM